MPDRGARPVSKRVNSVPSTCELLPASCRYPSLTTLSPHTLNMFKSSFAQDLLQETRHHNDVQEDMLPRERHSLYKSQFAASTHGPLDNISVSLEDDISIPPVRQNISVSSETTEPACPELQTSDLGTSDFSSSEIWPGPASNSSSPFEYSPRYRGRSFSGETRTVASSQRQSSFLNLQSSMQFSHLKRVSCKEYQLPVLVM